MLRAWAKAKLTWRPLARRHHLGQHAIARVVVDPGHHLELTASDLRNTPEMKSCCHSSMGSSRSQRT